MPIRLLWWRAIVLLDDGRATYYREETRMNHYMDFDPYFIRERNEQMLREVNSLRLEERLRKDRGSSGSRLSALAKRGVMPLLRAARLAG
jgi:hypothetical protein